MKNSKQERRKIDGAWPIPGTAGSRNHRGARVAELHLPRLRREVRGSRRGPGPQSLIALRTGGGGGLRQGLEQRITWQVLT